MLYLIEQRHFRDAAGYLWQAHKDRYRVFVKEKKWQELDSWLRVDIDQFDDADSRYLLLIDKGLVIGGLRIRPTTNSTLAADVFAEHYFETPPNDPLVWEYQRVFVNDPEWLSPDGFKAITLLHTGLLHYAFEHNIKYLSAQSETKFLPILNFVGWPYTLLGSAFEHSGGESIPIAMHCDAAAIESVARHTKYMVNPIVHDLEGLEPYPTPFLASDLYDLASAVRDGDSAPKFAAIVDAYFSGQEIRTSLNFTTLVRLLNKNAHQDTLQ